jgi:hypothetical protein
MKFSADIIKATVSMAYRDKQYLTCTEFRLNSHRAHLKDVVAIKHDEMIEFEIKISKSDLLGDAKKKKHRKEPTVNQFYYVVPKELIDDAINLVKKINSRYGVICFSCPYEGNNSPGIYVARRAALLKQKEAINPEIFEKVYRRLSYENGRLLMKLAKIELEK